MELDYPVEELEPLAFILNRLLGSLCERLNACSIAAQQINLHLDLQPLGVAVVRDDSETAKQARSCSPWRQPWGEGAGESSEPRRGDIRTRESDVAPPGLGNLKRDPNPMAGAMGYTTSPASRASRTPQSLYEKSIPLPVPTRDPKLLLNLLRMQLETDPPAAPIIKVALKATPASPRVAQGGLFAPPAPDPEKFEITLARIAGLVGQQNVGSPRLLDSHRPESFEMRSFALLPLEIGSAGVSPAVTRPVEAGCPRMGWGGTPQGQRARRPRYVAKAHPVFSARQPDSERIALRVYRPPVPASVVLKNGIPDQLSFRGIRGRVVTAGGPWRTSGCWWRPDAWQYDEWDIEMRVAGSGLAGFYRIYFDRALEKWFVRGEYD
jgi:hypothetical protein